MKKLCVLLLIFVALEVFGQQEAKTADGQKVILSSDGTWIYDGQVESQTFTVLNEGAGPIIIQSNEENRAAIEVFARIKNNSDKTFHRVYISTVLYDAEGRIIFSSLSDMFSSIENFLPKTIRTFNELINPIPINQPRKIEISIDHTE